MADVTALVCNETGLTIPEYSAICQTDNGTIFFTKQQQSNLYAIHGGKEIDAKLEKYIATGLYAHGNAAYFIHTDKVWKAVLTESNVIEVSILRDQMIPMQQNGSVCYSTRNGTKYCYRINEDPITDAISADAQAEGLYGLQTLGIHRGKLIYAMKTCARKPIMSDLNNSSIIIELPTDHGLRLFAKDSSPLLHITCRTGHIFVLNSETKQFLRAFTLQISGMHSVQFVGIVGGIVTISRLATDGNNKLQYPPIRHLVTAQLPEMENILIQNGADNQELVETNAQLKEDMEMTALRKQVADLTQALELAKLANEEVKKSTVEIFEENKALKIRVAELSDEMKEKEIEVGRHLRNLDHEAAALTELSAQVKKKDDEAKFAQVKITELNKVIENPTDENNICLQQELTSTEENIDPIDAIRRMYAQREGEGNRPQIGREPAQTDPNQKHVDKPEQTSQTTQTEMYAGELDAFTCEILKLASPEEQKQMLGERIYSRIIETYDDTINAGKLTGMILEMDLVELMFLIHDQFLFRRTVNEAALVLQSAAGKSEDKEETENQFTPSSYM